MKKLLSALLVSLAVSGVATTATAVTTQQIEAPTINKCQWINGYYRKDGTYVKGHYRGC